MPGLLKSMKYITIFLYRISLSAIIIGVALVGCTGPAGPDGDDASVADSLAPRIEWLSPETGAIIDSAVVLTAIATDDKELWKMIFYIAGFDFNGELIDSVNGVFEYRWDTVHWPEGPYPLMARAWDTARNHTSTQTVLIRIEH